jgi:hypothetical protein
MWDLMDYKTVQKVGLTKPFLSSKAQNKYDCNAEKYRTVYFVNYSEKMGAGKVVYTENQLQAWAPIAPETMTETVFKVACGVQ